MRQKKQWSELTDVQQAAIVVAGAIELVVTSVAVLDLVRRPQAAVRGPKVIWAIAMIVQPIGPVGYLCIGRR